MSRSLKKGPYIAAKLLEKIEAMNEKGYDIRKIHLSGGHLKNRVFIQEHADVTGCEILLPKEPEAVLLGAAILAAVAAGEYSDILQAMETMSRTAKVIKPNTSTLSFHEAKYELFKEMYDFQRAMRQTMETV